MMFAIVFMVFLVGTVSASWDWDNKKVYDDTTKTATIKNSILGIIPSDTLAEVTLLSNTEYCIVNCEAEMKLDLKVDYSNPFKELNFYNFKAKGGLVVRDLEDYEILVRTGSYIEEQEYEIRTCVDQVNKVGCVSQKKIREVTRYTWENFNDADLKAGEYHIKIKGEKNANEVIEWIPTFLGREIDEWATWGLGLDVGLYAYYNMSSNQSSVGHYNLTVVGTPTYPTANGLIEQSANITGEGVEFNIPGDVDAFNMVNAKNTSLRFWFRPDNSSLGEDGYLVSNYEGVDGGAMVQFSADPTKIYFYKWIDSVADWTSNSLLEAGNWTQVVVVRNASSACVYINVSGGSVGQDYCETPAGTVSDGTRLLEYGVAIVDRDFVGMIDEIGWWNRTLTPSEVNDLYNNGAGISQSSYESPLELTITLSHPADNQDITNSTIFFGANFSVGSGNVTNATLYVWNPGGTLFKKNITTLTGTSNSTNLSLSGFSVGAHPWNYFLCGVNSTDYNCTFANANRTVDINAFSIFDEYYVNETVEGNLEDFILNISVLGSLQVSTANLNYNGTNYAGTIENVGGGTFSLRRQLTIPQTNTAINNTFFWDIDLSDDSNQNSSNHNQSVFNFGVDNCTSHSLVILNYSLDDEELKTNINGSYYNTSIEVDVGIYSYGGEDLITNYSTKFTNLSNNHAPICINSKSLNNTQYSLTSVARYDGDEYAAEFYNIQNYTLTNTTIPQNISLYDLKDSDATTFLVTFKDTDFLPEEDALIQITRKYVADGIFRTVEIPKTDSSGQTIGHFDTDNVIYTIIVTKNGNTLASFENIVVVCEDAVIGDCKLNLNAASGGTPFTTWGEIGNLDYDISFSKSNRRVTTTFTTTDGSTRTISINTTKFDRFGNNTICTDSLSSSAGTLTCDIPQSFGNVTVVSDLYSDGELVTTRTFTIAIDPIDTFGNDAVIFVLILVLTLPLMMITDTIGMIFGAFVGLVVAGILLFYNTGSIFGETSIIIWFLVAGGIIVWKIWRVTK